MRFPVRKFGQRIVARDVKDGARRAVIGIAKVKRQQRRDRLAAIPGRNRAKSARLRKREARGAVWLEHGRGIHGGLLLALVSRRIRSRCRRRKMPRTGSGGKGDILNADVRSYRSCTAAASD